jgi:hypothetical protein
MEKAREKGITFEKLAEIYSPIPTEIKSEDLYKAIERFVEKYECYPMKDTWTFYFPCEENLILFSVFKHPNGDFSLEIREGGIFLIKKGEEEKNEKKQLLLSLIESAEKIQDKLTRKEIEEKIVYRYAWIKRRYIRKPELTREEGRKLLEDYKKSQENKQKEDINLERYLDVAAMLIKEITKDPRYEGLEPKEVYQESADFRRVPPFNQLDKIKNPSKVSNQQLLEAKKEDRKRGCHTFEILADTIELLPSDGEFFVLPIKIEVFYIEYLKAIQILIENKIPFSTSEEDLKYAINLATGDQIVKMVDVDIPKEKYSKVEKWEKLPLPKPKMKTRE